MTVNPGFLIILLGQLYLRSGRRRGAPPANPGVRITYSVGNVLGKPARRNRRHARARPSGAVAPRGRAVLSRLSCAHVPPLGALAVAARLVPRRALRVVSRAD